MRHNAHHPLKGRAVLGEPLTGQDPVRGQPLCRHCHKLLQFKEKGLTPNVCRGCNNKRKKNSNGS